MRCSNSWVICVWWTRCTICAVLRASRVWVAPPEVAWLHVRWGAVGGLGEGSQRHVGCTGFCVEFHCMRSGWVWCDVDFVVWFISVNSGRRMVFRVTLSLASSLSGEVFLWADESSKKVGLDHSTSVKMTKLAIVGAYFGFEGLLDMNMHMHAPRSCPWTSVSAFGVSIKDLFWRCFLKRKPVRVRMALVEFIREPLMSEDVWGCVEESMLWRIISSSLKNTWRDHYCQFQKLDCCENSVQSNLVIRPKNALIWQSVAFV